MSSDYVTVLWAGSRVRARVVRRFKNGKVRVEVSRSRWTGGRPGSASPGEVVTVEPWQVVEEVEQ